MQQKNFGVAKGDIVWARVQFPHQFWPSLVLSTDSLGVCVSFFNFDLSPRYFIESEVVLFEESFRWIMGRRRDAKRCETFYALLDSALRLMGLRVISSLKCRCQMVPSKRDYGRQRFDGSNSKSFQPNEVLGFVLRAAVLPWVDELDFVGAVRAVAQVQAFRGYCSIEQKRVYEKTPDRGNDVKPHQCSLLGENMRSVTEESVALEPRHECQILSKQVEENLTIGATKPLNSETPVAEGNIEPSCTQVRTRKVEFVQETSPHLHSLCLGPIHMIRESLQSEKQSLFLRFKNISDQNIANTCFKICSKLDNNFIRRRDNALELYCRLPDIKTTTQLTKKRRQLDHPVLCDSSFKLQKLPSSSSTHEASSSLKMIKSENDEDDSGGVILPSTLADCSPSYKMEVDSYLSSFLSLPIKLEVPNPFSNRSLSLTYIVGTMSCCMSPFKDAPHHVDFPPKDIVQENEGIGHISEYHRPWISQAKMLETDKSDQKHDQMSICFRDTAEKFTDDARSNSHEVEAEPVTFKDLKGSDSTPHQNRLQIDEAIQSARINISSRGCSRKNEIENLKHSDDTSHRMFNSKAGEQSKTQASHACSKSLHIKFPRNFKLPSKSELIKKFRVFGSIDYLKTRVFSYTGAAQVAFLQEADAVTAYLYAKRSKVSFGPANVRFWLDSFEHKRGSAKYRSSMSPSASEKPMPLKSCLKNSSSQKKDSRNRANVRFCLDSFEHDRGSAKYRSSMSPSASEKPIPLKPCLKNSSSQKKDSRNRPCKVRFTIVT